MSELPFQIERYIVKQLACDEAPETIAENVRTQFLRRVGPDIVRTYDPEADGSALTEDLHEVYGQTRREYRDASPEEERSFVQVATTDVFDDRSMYCVEEEGIANALIVVDDGYAALANRCTHQGGPLCEGKHSEGTVTCPWHGAKFEVDTGAPTQPPATDDVDTFEVRVRDEAIEVKL